MSKVTNAHLLEEITKLTKLMEDVELTRAERVDDLLFTALLVLTNLENTLRTPDFSHDDAAKNCSNLRGILMAARDKLSVPDPA